MTKVVLVIAASGRMLAQQARQSGFFPLVIDLFADQDTREIAADVRQVESLASKDLGKAITDLSKHYLIRDVVYGSGFEKHYQSLLFLQENFNLHGNSSDVFARIQDKFELFKLLLKNNIAFPEVFFSRPKSGKWMIKPVQSEGGFGIKYDSDIEVLDQPYYWQRFLEGESLSALFIANGKTAEIVGFNMQWTENHDFGQAFVFSGIHNKAQISDLNKQIIADWLTTLVPHFGLRGLNSLDFILQQDQCYFLEINPRPSASMELYDADLFTAHIKCCLDTELTNYSNIQVHKGYQIIFAQTNFQVPDNFVWPEWTQDRPRSKAKIYKQQPVCSIIASGDSSQQVVMMLATRKQLIENTLIEGNSYHAIRS